MKEVSQIDINQQKQERVYGATEISIVRKFIYHVLSLYSQQKIDSSKMLEEVHFEVDGVKQFLPDGQPKMRKPNFEKTCNIYANDILGLSEQERVSRLKKIKALYQAGHKGYQWPTDAIAHGTAPADQFNQMYREKFATGQDAIAQKPIPKSHRIERQVDDEYEKSGLEFLKNFREQL